jgi:Flp pilus assembly protein TadG
MSGAVLRRLANDRRAVSSLEFAVTSLAFFAFLLIIVNLGYLGLVLNDLKQGVQGAVRMAAVQTGAAMAASGNGGACVTAAQIIGYFNGIVTPFLPAATGAANDGTPVVQSVWQNNQSDGAYITVTARYYWAPIGLPNSILGLPLSISSTQMVLGTSGVPTSCS